LLNFPFLLERCKDTLASDIAFYFSPDTNFIVNLTNKQLHRRILQAHSKHSACDMRPLLLLALLLFSAPSIYGQIVDGKALVLPSLHVGSRDLQKPLTVAIRFKIEKDWHLYWKNAGDAGFAPRVIWQLPAGFSVSELRFPTPHKITEGDLVAFGYTDELILLADLIPDATAPTPKDLTISAAINWLVCKESCVPSDTTLSLTLSRLQPEDLAAGRTLIARAQAAMPEPLSKSTLQLERTTFDGKTLSLFFSGPDAKHITDFFPETHDALLYRFGEFKIENGAVIMPVSVQGQLPKSLDIKGIVMLGEKGYELHATVASSATLSAPSSETSQGGLLRQAFKTQDEPVRLSIGIALLFAVIGGIILNIMPCVLPVLSLKVMGLVQNAGQSKSESLKHGLVFMLGVLVSFWVLAIVAIVLQQAGEQIGWGFQFQSPIFVLSMILVVFIFGLNLAGLFEFSTPNVPGQVSRTLMRTDLLGSFTNGVLATTLATPCTAPFLGSALGFAFSQPPYVIFIIFTAVGFGLALPYLILAAQPQWLKFVPKPGPWMNRFKQAMSFLLFATVIWLLSVFGAQLGTEGVIAALVLLLAVSVGFWLVGQFADYGVSRLRRVAVWATALFMMGLTYLIVFERQLQWREPKVLSATTSLMHQSSIPWQPFSLEAIEQAVQSGKTVFVDFTADWCFTCKITEKTVIETELVEKKIAELGIIPIKADWTNRNDDITQLLKKFGRSGVPLYVVFPAGRLHEPIVLPEVLTPELLIETFERAAQAPTAASAPDS
jgi:thiol:disulfide interchange protein DsbD